MATKTIASLAIDIGVDLSDFDKSMKEFKKTWGKLGSQIQSAGTQIGTTFTAAGGAVAAGLGFAVKSAMDFDAQMARAGSIAGATSEELQVMRQSAIDLGASTSKSASEVAIGMELMAAKGFEVQEVLSAMPGVIAAAEASGEDMALVADTVASALNAFQLEASDATRVADVLAMSANTSAAGITDLQYAFKYAAPVANSLGISMEQLAAATGIMADNGMKGEQAGTTLRAALLRLTDPPKEAKKQMDALGLSVTDAAGNFLPLDQIIGQLKTSTDGMSNAQKAAALSTIFGTEAMTGMLSLVEAGPDKFNALTTGLQNSGGASAATAAQMKDNLAGSVEQLSGAFESMSISLGSALVPAVRAVADGLTGLVNWFNKLSPETQKFIAISAALVAGLLVLVGVIGFLVAAMGALATVTWATLAPVLAVIGVIALVTVAIVGLAILIYKYWDEIKASTITVWGAIVTALTTAWEWIKGVFQVAFDFLKPALQAFWDGVTAVFNAYIDTIVTIVTAWWELVKTIFATAFLAIVYLVTGQWDKLGDLFRAAGEKIVDIVSGAWGKIGDIWSGAFSALGNAAQRGWEWISGLFSSAWGGIEDFFSRLPGQMQDIGKDMMQGMINGITSMASNLASAAMDVVRSAIDAAKSFLKIGSPSKLFEQIGSWTGEGFAIGLENTEKMALDAGLTVAAAPLSALPDIDTQSTSDSGAATGQPMIIIQEIDGREISRTTLEYMGGMFRVKGAVT